MKIEKGQVWERKIRELEAEDENFPKGWKVEVTEVTEKAIFHKVVEWEGRPRNQSEGTPLGVNQFLELYTLLKL